MIRTRIVEAYADSLGKINERELGWCLMGEVPVEKKAPPPPGPNMPTPMVLKVNGENCFVIGHSWDISTKVIVPANLEAQTEASALPDAILVLIVQKIPAAPSGLVRAPAAALDQLDRLPGLGGGKLVNGRAN